MSDYRRSYVPGGMYFFTVVTYNRRPILTTAEGRKFLRSAINAIAQDWEFQLFATVLLPDHWHLVMQMPPGDADFSTRLKRIKEEFTRSWLGAGQPEVPMTDAQRKRRTRNLAATLLGTHDR